MSAKLATSVSHVANIRDRFKVFVTSEGRMSQCLLLHFALELRDTFRFVCPAQTPREAKAHLPNRPLTLIKTIDTRSSIVKSLKVKNLFGAFSYPLRGY